jgi:hypothetical protein
MSSEFAGSCYIYTFRVLSVKIYKKRNREKDREIDKGIYRYIQNTMKRKERRDFENWETLQKRRKINKRKYSLTSNSQ